jgi:hypothetical protein
MYGSYLERNGHVYGDMSDPAKRAEAITILRRRDAKSLAAIYRRQRRDVAEMTTEDIHYEMRVKRYQIEECANVRPWNIRNCDIHMYRMLHNELTRRAKGI